MTSSDAQPKIAGEHIPADGASDPSLLEWQEQLQASAGLSAIALMNRVNRMGYLLQGNVAQYKSLIARLQDRVVSSPSSQYDGRMGAVIMLHIA